MNIKDSCKCGSQFNVDDPTESYLTTGGTLDSNGRKFCIERIYSEWLEAHKVCREKTEPSALCLEKAYAKVQDAHLKAYEAEQTTSGD